MKTSLLLASLCLALTSFNGCRNVELTENTEAFSVVPFQPELMKRQFDKILNDPAVLVCVANLDLAGKFSISERMWENWISDSLEQWFSAMRSSTIGRLMVTTPIRERLQFIHSKKPCDDAYNQSSKVFSILFFPSVAEAEPYFCKQMKGNMFAQAGFSCGSKLQYSSGEQNTGTIAILPVVGSRSRPIEDFARTITHEFGHLLGLFDSYKMPPRVNFEGPPPHAVMAYTSDRVTRDDAAGIEVAMTWAYQGKIDCGPHTKARNTGYYPQILYCQMKPTKAPGKSHQEYFERLRQEETRQDQPQDKMKGESAVEPSETESKDGLP